MKRLAVVIYSNNNLLLTKLSLKHLSETIDPELTEVFVVDNASEKPYSNDLDLSNIKRIIRYNENTGANAVIHRWMQERWFAEGELPEFIAFFHVDLIIHEQHWDRRVIESFESDLKLHLLGFAGSNEIDELGGRGAGTMLNYRGAFFEGVGQASPAEAHGRKMTGLEPAAVLDHMSMIFRRTELEELTPQEGNFSPFHFYDKILSCEVLERGGHVAVLGIDCDHFSGGSGPGLNLLFEKWLQQEGIPYDLEKPDIANYLEAEKRFKQRYMHTGFAPLRVLPDYSIVRPGRK